MKTTSPARATRIISREAGFNVEPPVKNQGKGAAIMRVEALRRLGPAALVE